MIRLIVSDIDGTLLPYGQAELEPELFLLIRRLRERGVVFCPASGRQYHSLRALFRPVCDELAYICENGSIVFGPGPEDGAEVLGKTVIERAKAVELAHDILALPGCRLLISGANTSYIPEGDPWYENFMHESKGNNVALIARPEDVPEDIIKLAAYCPEGTSPCRHALAPKWEGVLSVASAGPDWVDFNLADKASGLETLCAALGIGLRDTAAFGDNWNDAPMLRLAGRGCIMSTSDPALRGQFALQCPNVLRVLENFLETGEI
jgi:Cof subfamily protein (haloacid dehalogenase superfamily)